MIPLSPVIAGPRRCLFVLRRPEARNLRMGRSGRASAALLAIIGVASALAATACEKVPLLAPSGSTITLTASTNALSANGSADIIAQILEASGSPPHSGTQITFTTTLGTVQPSEARTDINGRVVVKFVAGGANGNATITAFSGGATTGANGAVKIAVGTAAVGRVIVNASPAAVPAVGGLSTITANVLDVNGNVLSATPVSFSTTSGTLSAAIVNTDANGLASTILSTSQAATVTASVGATAPPSTTTPGTGTTPAPPTSSGQASGSVSVSIIAAPTLGITPPSTPPSVGLPASFTFVVTPAPQNGSTIRDVQVNWGDGQTQNLGAVSGSAVVSHVYGSAGTYTISATVTDVAGNSTTVSTAVTVIPVPRPTVLVTATPQTATVGSTITFNIQITAPPGIGIQSTTINFGDGDVRLLGGASSASVQKVYATAGTRTVTVSVLDTTGQITEGTTTVSITP